MSDIEKGRGILAGPSTPADRAELERMLKIKRALFCASEDPSLDMAYELVDSLKKQGMSICEVGIDLAGGSDWFEAVMKEKLPSGGTAMPTQRWHESDLANVFTSAQLAAAIATPENLRASLAKHGHVIFVLCQHENEERDRLRREGIDVDRIKFVGLPEVHKCDVCGDLAHYAYPRRADSGTHSDEYERRCYRHRKEP